MKTAKQLGNEPINAFLNPRTKENAFNSGITKREYFAGLAMQGLLTIDVEINGNTTFWKWIAEQSVKYADALLEELSK